nr:endonuclease 2 [Tanacetum cinerariifolium]
MAESSKKNKVMVAIDDSEFSEYALTWALKMLGSTFVDSELLIYTARTPVDISYLYASSWGRDCKDVDGVRGRCVAGAVGNYTTQLLEYSNQTSQYNLTESLLFLSHFMGDIHQPLHVGFTSDRGGNAIDVHWFTRKAVLHHVWDDSIIESAEDRFYGSNVENYIDAIQRNITNEWADRVENWENCSGKQTTCPNIYASEGIKAACNWAYKGVANDSVLRAAELIKELKESENKAAIDLLKKAKTTCTEYGITAEGIAEIGDPKVAICNAVEKLNVQLLIVGSHGRGALTRAFIGSVSNYCVNHAKCPVLVVKKTN